MPAAAARSDRRPPDIDRRARARGSAGRPSSNDARVLDLKQESDALYVGYLGEAIRLSLAGSSRSSCCCCLPCARPLRVARVLAPLVLAVLTVAAGLALCGVQLTILHLVGMLLIVAVGSNYALFFDRHAIARGDGSR